MQYVSSFSFSYFNRCSLFHPELFGLPKLHHNIRLSVCVFWLKISARWKWEQCVLTFVKKKKNTELKERSSTEHFFYLYNLFTISIPARLVFVFFAVRNSTVLTWNISQTLGYIVPLRLNPCRLSSSTTSLLKGVIPGINSKRLSSAGL